jgi:hypothetical protein
MLIKLDTFAGIYPKLNMEKLPPNAASYAVNCNFDSGAVVGLRTPETLLEPLNSVEPKSGFFFYDNDNYGAYSLPHYYDTVHAPLQNDQYNRFYRTRWDSNEFTFGLYGENTDSQGGWLTTVYKVGVIDSTKWTTDKIGELGIKLKKKEMGAPAWLSEVAGVKAEILIVDKEGKEISPQPTGTSWYTVTAIGDVVNGIAKSYEINLIESGKNISSYAGVKKGEFLRTDVDGEGVSTPVYADDVPIAPYLAFRWTATYQGQTKTATIYEDKNLSGAMDFGIPVTASLVRIGDNKDTVTKFTLTPSFGEKSENPAMEVRSYIITFVNELGEESEPSMPDPLSEIQIDPLSEQVTFEVDGAKFDGLVNGGMFAQRYNVHGVRIYRTASASNGDTDFLYAGTVKFTSSTKTLPGEVYLTYTVAGGTITAVDDIPAAQLGSACPTQDAIRNTNELQALKGVIRISNNMLAAFKGNEVWVCEPAQPAVWKPHGIHTLDMNVVALVPAEQGFYALTKGSPYYISGTLPENMQPTKLPSAYPALNHRAVTSLGNNIIYASSDGLVLLSGLQAQLDPHFSREAWRDEFVETNYDEMLCLAAYGNRVLGYFPGAGSPHGYMFDTEDGQWSRIDQRIDYALPAPAGTLNLQHDSLAFTDGSGKWKIFGANNVTGGWRWKSAVFVMPKPVPMAVIQLFGIGSLNTLTIYCDDPSTTDETIKTLHTYSEVPLSRSGTVLRIPGGMYAKWMIEMEANETGAQVTAVKMASTMAELNG